MTVAGRTVTVHRFSTVIVGAGAAGMRCALSLGELMSKQDITDIGDRVAIVTRGVGLGASRMSGSDKQTYYKMGTDATIPDSAEGFAATLTAGGCCHEDLALTEGIGSLRGFYDLVRVGVPFPHDPAGSFVGYKTDHDPAQRATSAGPKTSKFMSECLHRQVDMLGIGVFDHQEVAALLTEGEGDAKRIVGVAAIELTAEGESAVNVFLCENLVLAAGGPGELYADSVYPAGQVGLHGLALKAGLAAENLTESQFGLASTKFRWNVSGTYMQVVPRIFSTDANGGDEREFLAEVFPSMRAMATAIFLKGYQWPFDPQRITDYQSSLIDLLVTHETSSGRRVFMDFRENPRAGGTMTEFSLTDMEPEAAEYLQATGADQATPIERLAHMNPLAIDLYSEHSIDLWTEPLEIAVCAQHNNGGMAVDRWWQSTVPHTFVVGEMAGTHGVKRPGGSALNAGQVGAMRATEYIVNVYGCDAPTADIDSVQDQLGDLVGKIQRWQSGKLDPRATIDEIRQRMTQAAGHIRNLDRARTALDEAVVLIKQIDADGFAAPAPADLTQAALAQHMAITSAAILKAIVELLSAGSGSRGSHVVSDDAGQPVQPPLDDPYTRRPLHCRPENKDLRNTILRIRHDAASADLFTCEPVPIRKVTDEHEAFEVAWRKFREGDVYRT
jgi:succinate dehydrogenase/fumarate reductase flavoprotein subunit